jgi:hypothetical protein
MLKKLSIILLSFYATAAFAGEAAKNAVQPSGCVVKYENGAYVPSQLPNDLLSRAISWGFLGGSAAARNAVAALLTYCIAYTMYQTARGVGSTVWTWWKGEAGETLSPSLQRQIEIATAEAIRRNGLGQMAIRRSPAHHDEGTCTCGNCCEARRVRQ